MSRAARMAIRLGALIALTTLTTLSGCGGKDEGGATQTKASEEIAHRYENEFQTRPVRVVTTTSMIADVVRTVGGERVGVRSLMGPGIDPHLYKASEGDVQRLHQAQIIFYNGLHLEARLAEMLARLGDRVRTVAVAEGIDSSRLLKPPEFEGAHDPHVWFDVTLWMEAVAAVRRALVEEDPDFQNDYNENTRSYLAELGELHGYVTEQIATIPKAQRVLVTAHDAFNYFGRAYDIEVRGLQGISTVSEAGTADVQELAAFIARRKIPAVFVESSVPPRAIEAVRAAVQSKGFALVIGGELFSDALGDHDTPAGTYIGMVRHNADTIVAALTSSPGAAPAGQQGQEP